MDANGDTGFPATVLAGLLRVTSRAIRYSKLLDLQSPFKNLAKKKSVSISKSYELSLRWDNDLALQEGLRPRKWPKLLGGFPSHVRHLCQLFIREKTESPVNSSQFHCICRPGYFSSVYKSVPGVPFSYMTVRSTGFTVVKYN